MKSNTKKKDIDKIFEGTLYALPTNVEYIKKKTKEIKKVNADGKLVKNTDLHYCIEGSKTTMDWCTQNTPILLKKIDESKFTHNPKIDDTKLIITPREAKKTGRGGLKVKLAKKLGKQTPIDVKLMHSGFRVFMVPVGPTDRMAIIRNVLLKIMDGIQDTSGLIFSNVNSHIEDYLLQEAKKRIAGATLIYDEEDDLYDAISILDTDTLITGLVRAMFPKGFPISTQCKNILELKDTEDGKKEISCDYAIAGIVNFANMIKTDTSSISPIVKKNIVIEEASSIEYESVKNFLDAYPEKELDVGHDIKINLYMPTISRKIETAATYKAYIERKVEESLYDMTDLQGEAKDELVESTRRAIEITTILGAYLPYIKSIDIDGIFDDDTEIMEALEEFAENADILNKVLEGITEYIAENLNTIIGINGYICPNCSKEVKPDTPNKLDVIPYDIVKVFIYLLSNSIDIN